MKFEVEEGSAYRPLPIGTRNNLLQRQISLLLGLPPFDKLRDRAGKPPKTSRTATGDRFKELLVKLFMLSSMLLSIIELRSRYSDILSARQGSNLRPLPPEGSALSAELRAQLPFKFKRSARFHKGRREQKRESEEDIEKPVSAGVLDTSKPP